jgi:DNA repair exonuclease SbcCD ATPase subunit
MNKNLIIHLSDLHIRLNSRHEECREVFEKTIEKIKEIKPLGVVITGDVFHIKINMSPKSVSIAGWFLKELSKISPVFLIAGNHDLNEKILIQGNTIEPLIEILENGFVLNKKNSKEVINLYKKNDINGIYFFKETSFYKFENGLVFGAFSMIDNEMLQLNEKEEGKKYIALYHNPVFGCKMDNGLENKREDLVKITDFANFDIVMLGDIHKCQTFKRKHITVESGKVVTKEKYSAAYPGSVLQQHFGEEINHGFLVWNLETFTSERVIVPNNYGYCKLKIKYGENLEKRLKDLYFSADKTKTKVLIEYQEKEEEYSAEKERQIISMIKKEHGCESVTLDCEFIKQNRETGEIEEIDESQIYEDFEDLLTNFMNENGFDLKEDVIQLSRDIDKELNAGNKKIKTMDWYLNRLEIQNLFSFPDTPTIIDFDKLNGITGVFGNNYSGKSNVIRALVWTLYGKILGDGESYDAVNLYTKSNMSYGDLYLTIDKNPYRIYREIKVNKSKKNDKISCSFDVKFQYLEGEEWKDMEKEIGATEKIQSKQLIEETLGTFDDFTKVCLQAQGGKNDYLGLAQQPKNDLINKYLGLEIFRYRYDLANNRFKEIKAIQKHLGDVETLKVQISDLENKIAQESEKLSIEESYKISNQNEINKINQDIFEVSKKITPVKNVVNMTEEQIDSRISSLINGLDIKNSKISELKLWVDENLKKDVPVDNPREYDKNSLQTKIKQKQDSFQNKKNDYTNIDYWIKNNPKKEEVDTNSLEEKRQSYLEALKELKNKHEIAKGKKCPTCNSEVQKADPELEKQCAERIIKGKELVEAINEKIAEGKNIVKHNNTFDSQVNNLNSLKNDLTYIKQELESLKEKFDLSDKINEIVIHNNQVDLKNKELQNLYAQVLNEERSIDDLKSKKQILIDNKSVLENNKVYEEEVMNLKELVKNYQLNVYNIEKEIRDLTANIRVDSNTLESLKNKIESIDKAERDYKKYSIYLQAVHRDGIPSHIIRKKIPIINSKINSIVGKIANFKVELSIKENGDIKEHFYYNEDMSDKLSLSMGSGSQKFIATVAIRDALHFVSCLTKPSFCAIDEGFDTLDQEKKQSIVDVLDYLKAKYKNVFVITHLSEIKDVVENEVQVSRHEFEESGEIRWYTEFSTK